MKFKLIIWLLFIVNLVIGLCLPFEIGSWTTALPKIFWIGLNPPLIIAIFAALILLVTYLVLELAYFFHEIDEVDCDDDDDDEYNSDVRNEDDVY